MPRVLSVVDGLIPKVLRLGVKQKTTATYDEVRSNATVSWIKSRAW